MISAGTANVNSMYNGQCGHAGMTSFLRQPFIYFGLNFLGMQETRTPESFGQCDAVLRPGTSCKGRLYGLELWVNLKVTFCYTGKQAHSFSPCDFQVLHRDSRAMLAQVETEFLKMKVLVGHAPHSGCEQQVCEDWWSSFSALAGQRDPHERLVVLLDANADPGHSDGHTVFLHDARSTTNSLLLRDFLHTHSLCLPATSPRHTGPIETWTSPNGQHHHCIDHVVLPQEHLQDCVYSSALPEFDLGNGCWDLWTHGSFSSRPWRAGTVSILSNRAVSGSTASNSPLISI